MFFKPTTRLIAVKFLGLFGGSSLQKSQQDSDIENNSRALKKQLSAVPDHETAKDDPELAADSTAVAFGSKKVVGVMLERGIPGLTICVSRRGRVVWSGAFGFCDVENLLECRPEASMRIASISKPIFASTVIGKMIEQSEISLESSIYKYLSPEEFPRQKFEGREADITVKQLLSHTSGIKHYGPDQSSCPPRPIGSRGSQKIYQTDDQYNRLSKFERKTYRGSVEALEPIRDGPLETEPGKFSYSSYGYTLLSAVAEKALHLAKASKRPKEPMEQIEDFWVKLLRREWGLAATNLDQDEPIIRNRARYYLRTGEDGRLINAPYVDNSVKWAGGGLTSTTRDLVKFGWALIDSYKERASAKLKRSTVELLWTKVVSDYCLGFMEKRLDPAESGGELRAIYHTGSAIGGSSVLIVYPETEIVVAILSNLGEVNLAPVGIEIANKFSETK